MQPNRELRTAGTIELRTVNGSPVLFGRPIVYDAWSHPIGGQFRERFRPGSLDKCLSQKPEIYCCMYHDERMLLGTTKAGTLRILPDAQGVAVECDPPGTSYAADLQNLIKRGDIQGMSFIFRAVQDEWDQRDGETFRDVIEADICEVCYLHNPAYPQTTVGIRSANDYAAEIARRVKPARGLKFAKARLRMFEMQ